MITNVLPPFLWFTVYSWKMEEQIAQPTHEYNWKMREKMSWPTCLQLENAGAGRVAYMNITGKCGSRYRGLYDYSWKMQEQISWPSCAMMFIQLFPLTSAHSCRLCHFIHFFESTYVRYFVAAVCLIRPSIMGGATLL